MEVEDAGELRASLVSVQRRNSKVKISVRVHSSELFELHPRGCKKLSDLFKNIYVASRRVAESWRIDQSDMTAV